MFGKSLDRAALASGITSLEQQYDFLVGSLYPVLHLEQFDLQLSFLLLVTGTRDFLFVRIFAGFKDFPDRILVMTQGGKMVGSIGCLF